MLFAPRTLLAFLASLLLAPIAPAQSEPAPATPPEAPVVTVRSRSPREPVKDLFCTASFGFKHDVLPLARKLLTEKAEELDWLDLTATDSADDIAGTRLLPTLAGIDVLMLYTTGRLPFDPKQLAAWVEAGGTLVGIHSATDTLSDDPDYVPLIGGVFDGHPWNEEVTLTAPDAHPDQPDLGFIGKFDPESKNLSFRLADEIYQFKQLSTNRTVTLSLAPGQPKMEDGREYPLAWTSVRGKGRVFYTALGHRPEVWRNPEFIWHVLNGLWWASENSGTRSCAACNVQMAALPIQYGLLAEAPDPTKVIAGGCIVGPAKHGYRCPKCGDTVIPGN